MSALTLGMLLGLADIDVWGSESASTISIIITYAGHHSYLFIPIILVAECIHLKQGLMMRYSISEQYIHEMIDLRSSLHSSSGRVFVWNALHNMHGNKWSQRRADMNSVFAIADG